MKGIRRQMMSGTLPSDCFYCISSNKTETYKESLKNRYYGQFETIEKSTSDDGTSTAPLVFLDYRSHGCNLKCKTCGPDSSSAWLKQAMTQNSKWEDIAPMDILKQVEFSVKNSPYASEFLEVVKNNPIEVIYFAGGEPLISKAHDEVLDELIHSKRGQKMTLNYNTNLTVPLKTVETWFEKLLNFSEVHLYCSIDGTEEVTQYVRTGMKFKVFEKNLKFLKQNVSRHPSLHIYVDATITSLFLLDLKAFSQMALDWKTPVVSKLMIGVTHRGAFLRCEALPKKLREKLVSEWMDYFNSLKPEEQALLENLKNTLTLARSAEEFPQDVMKEARRQARINDQAFEEKKPFGELLKHNKEASKWWASLID